MQQVIAIVKAFFGIVQKSSRLLLNSFFFSSNDPIVLVHMSYITNWVISNIVVAGKNKVDK